MSQSGVLDRVDAFIRDLDDALNPQSVRGVLVKQLSGLGFDLFSFQKFAPPTGVVENFYVSTYPRAWTKRYVEKKYIAHDICTAAATQFSRPYLWADLGRPDDFTKEQKTIFDESRQFGIVTGASIPAYSFDGVRAQLSVASDMPADEFRKLFAANRHVLLLVTAYVHERLEQLRFYECSASKSKLTRRELEILTWGARGKTNIEIGDILSISDETVVKHYRNICLKLRAANKTQAVAKALMHRLIQP
jgi:LuxR family quorum sensing-dependent transcriptional regulator